MVVALLVLEQGPARSAGHTEPRSPRGLWGRIHRRTAESLRQAGLASWADRLWTITESGRAALAEERERLLAADLRAALQWIYDTITGESGDEDPTYVLGAVATRAEEALGLTTREVFA